MEKAEWVLTDEWMITKEAAEYLGVSRQTILRWIWSGQLPAHRLGNKYYLRRADLDKMFRPVDKKEVEGV